MGVLVDHPIQDTWRVIDEATPPLSQPNWFEAPIFAPASAPDTGVAAPPLPVEQRPVGLWNEQASTESPPITGHANKMLSA